MKHSTKILTTLIMAGFVSIGAMAKANANSSITFTIPVTIDNIQMNWQKANVVCGVSKAGNIPGGSSSSQDISLVGKTSISQTVTVGGAFWPDDAYSWACFVQVTTTTGRTLNVNDSNWHTNPNSELRKTGLFQRR